MSSNLTLTATIKSIIYIISWAILTSLFFFWQIFFSDLQGSEPSPLHSSDATLTAKDVLPENIVHSGFEEQAVVILDGPSGIGLAEQLVAQDAHVIASSNADRVRKAQSSFNGDVEGHAVDLSDEQVVEAFFTTQAKSPQKKNDVWSMMYRWSGVSA